MTRSKKIEKARDKRNEKIEAARTNFALAQIEFARASNTAWAEYYRARETAQNDTKLKRRLRKGE